MKVRFASAARRELLESALYLEEQEAGFAAPRHVSQKRAFCDTFS